MKCLRINDGKGEFSINGHAYLPLDQINKDNLLSLLEIALDPQQEFEMDEYDGDSFTNPAHKVIYNNIHDKFVALKASKAQFTTEVSELYQEAYDKYKLEDEA